MFLTKFTSTLHLSRLLNCWPPESWKDWSKLAAESIINFTDSFLKCISGSGGVSALPLLLPRASGFPAPRSHGRSTLQPRPSQGSSQWVLFFCSFTENQRRKRQKGRTRTATNKFSKIRADINDAAGKSWPPMSLTIGGKLTTGVVDYRRQVDHRCRWQSAASWPPVSLTIGGKFTTDVVDYRRQVYHRCRWQSVASLPPVSTTPAATSFPTLTRSRWHRRQIFYRYQCHRRQINYRCQLIWSYIL